LGSSFHTQTQSRWAETVAVVAVVVVADSSELGWRQEQQAAIAMSLHSQ